MGPRRRQDPPGHFVNIRGNRCRMRAPGPAAPPTRGRGHAAGADDMTGSARSAPATGPRSLRSLRPAAGAEEHDAEKHTAEGRSGRGHQGAADREVAFQPPCDPPKVCNFKLTLTTWSGVRPEVDSRRTPTRARGDRKPRPGAVAGTTSAAPTWSARGDERARAESGKAPVDATVPS